LGIDLPLLLVEKPKYKWAMSAPVSIHMVWAPFEPNTSPIINNDYRFGLSFTGITYLNNDYVKNMSFKLTPFAHESTHLGDELTMYGIEHIDNFFRVNVSYEYYELGLTLNDPDTLSGNLLSFKAGFMGLIRPHVGYYTYTPSEIGDTVLYPSKRWAEFYFELNYRKTEGVMTSETWHPSFSFELRNRVKYEYGNPEKAERVWCFNGYVGYDYIPRKSGNIKSVGHYLRYYSGLNPHGQFRNGSYRFIGYSIVAYI
jgi:hypothetical protein